MNISLIDTNQKTACFTGHRPEKIFSTDADLDIKLALLKRNIRIQIECAIDDGYINFISGMARGTDIFFAELVLYLKQRHPEIKLICALPFPGQGSGFSQKWRGRYNAIIDRCDEKVAVCESYSKQSYIIRNKYMVDRSQRVIAVYNGAPGGTAGTVSYAKSKNREIIIINPDNLLGYQS